MIIRTRKHNCGIPQTYLPISDTPQLFGQHCCCVRQTALCDLANRMRRRKGKAIRSSANESLRAEHEVQVKHLPLGKEFLRCEICFQIQENPFNLFAQNFLKGYN